MTIKEFEKKIEGKYKVTKMNTDISYVFRLGDAGSVILQYHNGEFRKMHINGKKQEEIEKTLLK